MDRALPHDCSRATDSLWLGVTALTHPSGNGAGQLQVLGALAKAWIAWKVRLPKKLPNSVSVSVSEGEGNKLTESSQGIVKLNTLQNFLVDLAMNKCLYHPVCNQL